jgi:hypothetical protein
LFTARKIGPVVMPAASSQRVRCSTVRGASHRTSPAAFLVRLSAPDQDRRAAVPPDGHVLHYQSDGF